MEVGRRGSARLLNAGFTHGGGGGAHRPVMTSPAGPCSAGLPAPIAHPSARTSKASTRGRRAGGALGGHEQGASGFVHGGARVSVSDVRGKARRLGSAVALWGQTAMRARAKGSPFTNWVDGEGPETLARAGSGGLPQ